MREDVKTLIEIDSQPAAWRRCLRDLGALDLESLVLEHDPHRVEWVFVGCGTSFYLAQAAASSFTS